MALFDITVIYKREPGHRKHNAHRYVVEASNPTQARHRFIQDMSESFGESWYSERVLHITEAREREGFVAGFGTYFMYSPEELPEAAKEALPKDGAKHKPAERTFHERVSLDKAIGVNQFHILGALIEHRGWRDGCGWYWTNTSTTVRLLEALVKHGLAKKVGLAIRGTVVDGYEATDHGRAYVKLWEVQYNLTERDTLVRK